MCVPIVNIYAYVKAMAILCLRQLANLSRRSYTCRYGFSVVTVVHNVDGRTTFIVCR